MKKRHLVFLFLISAVIFSLISYYAFSHEGEDDDEFNLNHSKIYPFSQLAVFGYGSLIFGILIIVVLLFHKIMSEIMKKVVYFSIVGLTSLVTIYFIATTLHLNAISLTKGPVHWHADFQIWVCGEEIKLAEPKGLSNKQGVDLSHAHNDNRIHVEGVILDEKQASLRAFFFANGGSLSDDGLKIPTDEGLVSVHNSDKCNEKPAKLYVFVNGNLIDSPSDYVISRYEKVPPGDRIKFVFTEKPIEEINPYITSDKNIDVKEHKSIVLPASSLCDLNKDGICDENDIDLFKASLGSCRGAQNYNVIADINADGCVSEGDGRLVGLYNRRGIPLGDESERFFNETLKILQKLPPGEPMTESPQPLCDLDGDFDCDNDDLSMLEVYMGKCSRECQSIEDCKDVPTTQDLDADGCVTSADRDIFLQLQEYYKNKK
ncbi:MAG: hypothetical protein AABX33_04800 [Nanoarchaeota archaeon]